MTPEKIAYMSTTPEVNGPMELTQKPDSPTCARQAMEHIRPLVAW